MSNEPQRQLTQPEARPTVGKTKAVPPTMPFTMLITVVEAVTS